MHYYAYKITNLVNQKIYIGIHQTNNINDNYMGSGKLLRRAYKKYGLANFQKDIIQFFETQEDMAQFELDMVNEEFRSRKDTYNIAIGGGYGSKDKNGLTFSNHSHSLESKIKMSCSTKGRKLSDEHKKKLSINNWARKDPVKQKEHARKAASKTKTEEHKQKIREALINLRKTHKQENIGGFKNKGVKKPTVICPFCSKTVARHLANRWHFNNCKLDAGAGFEPAAS